MKTLRIQPEDNLLWVEISSERNTIGRRLIEELTELLREGSDSPLGQVLILSGSGRQIFCPGLDLHEVIRYDRAAMKNFMLAFQKLYLSLFSHPRPTVAMVNGHAVAGGCILAACCDFRLGHTGVRMGMTEMNLSVPLPYGSLRILEARTGHRNFKTAAFLGKSYGAQGALGSGLLDKVCAWEDLREETKRLAHQLSGRPLPSFRLMKEYALGQLTDDIRRRDEAHLDEFLDCWFHPETRSRLDLVLRRLSDGDDKSRSAEA